MLCCARIRVVMTWVLPFGAEGWVAVLFTDETQRLRQDFVKTSRAPILGARQMRMYCQCITN